MSEPGRDSLGGQGLFVLSALVVTIVVAVGVVIAHQDSPPPPTPHPTASPAAVPRVHDVASVRPVSRLSGDAARFDASTGDWAGEGTTLTRATTPVQHGNGALELSTANPLGGQMTAWSPPAKAVGGDRYVGGAWVRAITAIRGAKAELRFLDASGQTTDTETGSLVTDSLTGWTQLPDVAAIAPKGTAQVQLGVVFPVVGPGAMHVVDDASLQQTPGGSTDVVPPLQTYGAQIFDGNKQPVILRGLQRFGLEGGTQTKLPDEQEISELKLWGANEVRISLGEQKWLTTNCHYEKGYPAQVDKVVHWVTSRGMVALLNLHFAALGDCGTPGLTPMADSPSAITFWQEVADRYKTNGLVAFDLFNEPQVNQSTWLDGGPFTFNNQNFQAVGMQQLYDTVRDTGALNLVIVSGLDFASRPPTQGVIGANVVYGIHSYTCPSAAPPQCASAHPYDPSPLLGRWVDFGKLHPVLVTEFGWPDRGVDGTYNANVIAYAEAHHWGWSGFAWDGGTDGLFDLVQNTLAHGDDETVEPNQGGMPLVAGFTKNTHRGSGG
ncbi:MAG: cellulase family glycosylhydrolase [Frankiaceae bacterium]|nr:cellulase family glycosylhydrolase [Frankiaceae bacterium]